MRVLFLGTGYVAQHLAALLPGVGMAGTCRDPAKADTLRAQGITPLAPEALRFDGFTHILISAAPGAEGDPFLARHADQIAGARPEWVGYLSATSVYGDHGGAWVDEETPPAPSGPRGAARLAAEQAWAATGLPLHRFRLAGIYGPGRSPLDRILAGEARVVVKPGQYFSRIHVEDIARALLSSMRAPEPGLLVNLADDDPAPPQDVLRFAAGLLGLPPPEEVPFETAEMSAMARSFYADNKRICNGRMKARLRLALRHPDYREGLRALLRAGP